MVNFLLTAVMTVITILSFSSPSCHAKPGETVSGPEKALNFGAVYVVQWGFYLYTQQNTIHEHGSLDNLSRNIFKARFDRDYLDYNVVKHTLAGNYYYLFYRSRGYTQIGSFLWSFISSFAFEYTIETYTEPPSIQDLYITPVYGSVMGIGMEKFSLYLLSLKNWPAHLAGYILNPFALLPFSKYDASVAPLIDDTTYGANVVVRF